MKISVITVCRNAEDCVEHAISSVISQTYSDIEYIVIDGASEDGTQGIIKRHGDRITKFISEPDGGVYEAMNKGIRLASGEYLFFLNADDAFIDRDVVQDVVTRLEQHPTCDFLYGDLLFQIKRSDDTVSQLVTFPAPEGLPKHLISDCLLHQASFSKRSLFDKLGYFSEAYRIGSDYEWFLRLISEANLDLHYYSRTIVSYNAGGMSSDMRKTLAEMFEIQNNAPFYQTEYWLRRRIETFQEIIQNPKGRFGLTRVTVVPSQTSPDNLQTTQGVDRVNQLQARVKTLKKQKQRLQRRAAIAETKAAHLESVIRAMESSKFWKLRNLWFRLRGLDTLVVSESSTARESDPSNLQRAVSPKQEENPISKLTSEQDSTSMPISEPASEFDQYFDKIREPKIKSPVPASDEAAERIMQRLQQHDIKVEEFWVDADDYRRYFSEAGYVEDFPSYYSFNLPEKSLEHYIAAQLLAFRKDDIYIDVASEGSPVPQIYTKLFGATSYRQDLAYPPGLNGSLIGGDAAHMPVPDSFASKMALHCSLEHFEGTSDIGFIQEVGRVLRPGGSVCIVPLYLAEQYSIQTDPIVSVPAQVEFEADAIIHAASGWNNRHGRFYDPEHLVDRIAQNLNGLQLKLFRLKNVRQVDPTCYAQFAALITKPI